MIKSGLFLCAATAAALLTAPTEGKEWAVLVCGSRGYYNYRHHADVCHAYQTLKRRGIPDERIITMMYDDVAHDQRNPFPGKIFNRPTAGSNPVDVYEGCLKDYTGEDVTPENFIRVIQGDASELKGVGSGKVLNSTAEDDVFINFVDHGAPGLVAFPTGELYAKQLQDALDSMYQKKMYKNLVFYMEACESGSMFQTLPQGRNIYAVTAANERESSWATYCPPGDDVVDGKHLYTCLGDEFSVNWLENTDSVNGPETLLQQYQAVKTLTKKSHVLDFGDVGEIASNNIDDFLGNGVDLNHPLVKSLKEKIFINETRLVDSRDVTLVSKFHRYLHLHTEEAEKELLEEIEHRKQVAGTLERITRALLTNEKEISSVLEAVPPANPQEWECHETANRAFKKMCLNNSWSDFSLKYSASLLSICETLAQTNSGTAKIVAAIASECLNSVELA